MSLASPTSELLAPSPAAATPSTAAEGLAPFGAGTTGAAQALPATGPPPAEGPPGNAPGPQRFGELLEASLARTAKSEGEKPKAKDQTGAAGPLGKATEAELAGAQAAAAVQTQGPARQAGAKQQTATAASGRAQATAAPTGRVAVLPAKGSAPDVALADIKGQPASAAKAQAAPGRAPAGEPEAATELSAPSAGRTGEEVPYATGAARSAAAQAGGQAARPPAAAELPAAGTQAPSVRPAGSSRLIPAGAKQPPGSPADERAQPLPAEQAGGFKAQLGDQVGTRAGGAGIVPGGGGRQGAAGAQGASTAQRATGGGSAAAPTSGSEGQSGGAFAAAPAPARPLPAQAPPTKAPAPAGESQSPTAKGLAAQPQANSNASLGEQPSVPAPQQLAADLPGAQPVSAPAAGATEAGFSPQLTAGFGSALAHQIESLRATVAVALRSGRAQARISLSPPELGAVRIRLTQSDGGLIARVSAESGAAAQALAESQSELRSTLSSLGITLLHLDISGGSGGQTRAGGAHKRPRAAGARTSLAAEEEAPDAVAPIGTTAAFAARRSIVNVLA